MCVSFDHGNLDVSFMFVSFVTKVIFEVGFSRRKSRPVMEYWQLRRKSGFELRIGINVDEYVIESKVFNWGFLSNDTAFLNRINGITIVIGPNLRKFIGIVIGDEIP
jgi:hypothetical protein